MRNMKTSRVILAAVLLMSLSVNVTLFCIHYGKQVHGKSVAVNQFHVVFSPKGGCTKVIVDEIALAKKSIFVQAYSFTSKPLATALAEAKARGVNVRVILDRSQEGNEWSVLGYLKSHKVPVLIDSKHPIAHNKIMIIDDGVVITGSFNFTKQAEEGNAENLVILRSEQAVNEYWTNWKTHADHSKKPE